MPILLRHNRIHLDAYSEPVTGIVIEGERVVAVGDAEALAAQVSLDSTVDLPGVAVLPGLVDAHLHLQMMANQLTDVDLFGARSLGEALARVARYLDERRDGGWVLGGRWDSNRWAEPIQPTADDLDRVTGDRPAFLETVDGHSGWANSAALAAAGIDAATADPPGGRIMRDHAGRATGILQEEAMALVVAVLPPPESLVEDLATVQAGLLSVGLTGVHDIDADVVRVGLEQLRADGRLDVRVHKLIRQPDLDAAIDAGRRTGDGDRWLGTGAVKLFSDGALGSHTCHMCRGFVGRDGAPGSNTGIEVTSLEEMVAVGTRAVSAGIAVATHAIGDRANQLVLDAYEHLLPAARARRLRLRVEHAQLLRPQDVVRFGALAEAEVVASMQPTHCTSDHELVDRLLAGHDLAAYPWRSLLAAGAHLAFGSDAPVELANPFHGLHAAVTRRDADGRPPEGWRSDETISAAAALEAFTVGSAFAAGWERDQGTLHAGKLADLICVDRDPLDPEVGADDPDAIRHTRTLLTMVGGITRFAR